MPNDLLGAKLVFVAIAYYFWKYLARSNSPS